MKQKAVEVLEEELIRADSDMKESYRILVSKGESTNANCPKDDYMFAMGKAKGLRMALALMRTSSKEQ